MNPFGYTPAEIARIEAALSTDRFSTYLRAAAGNGLHALRIYEWNSRISAAFYLPLHSVEVGLRNACHRELSATFRAPWYDDPAFLALDGGFAGKIAEARKDLRLTRTLDDEPHMIASLSFGFWTRLFSHRLARALWVPILNRAPARYAAYNGRRPRREDIANPLQHMRIFRNRIAHHEPIFNRALASDLRTLLELASWFYEDLAEWTNATSDCAALIAYGIPLAPRPTRIPGWCGPMIDA